MDAETLPKSKTPPIKPVVDIPEPPPASPAHVSHLAGSETTTLAVSPTEARRLADAIGLGKAQRLWFVRQTGAIRITFTADPATGDPIVVAVDGRAVAR